jgi:hypothetical protein
VHESLVKHLRGVSRWLALIDIDEFMVPTRKDTILEFVRDYEDFGALYLRWEPFGTSYVARLADRQLMTSALYLKWRFIKGFNMVGKSIVKPHRVSDAGVHHCKLMAGFHYWDSNPAMQSETSLIRLFHYWTRDEDFLFRYKLPRTLLIKDWSNEGRNPDFFRTLFNEVPDFTMRRFERQLRQRVFATSPTADDGLPSD